MKRLFTFGCSFTQYWKWPTWADLLGSQFDFYENWGICGTGNPAILYNLIECHQRNCINQNDTVVVMWTNTSREDRYVDGRWYEGGNIYWTAGSELPESYVRKFADERGFLIRDLAVIAAVKNLLEHWGCQWHFLSMIPIADSNEVVGLGSNPGKEFQNVSDAIALYKDVIEHIKPSVFETVFDKNWNSRPGIYDQNVNRRDFHPTPEEHLLYLDRILPEYIVDQRTRDWAVDITNDMMQGKPFNWTEPNRPTRL